VTRTRTALELVAYVLFTAAPVAVGIWAIDLGIGRTQVGSYVGIGGAACAVAGAVAWWSARVGAVRWGRFIAVFSGLWSMIAFALFIVWRIGTAGESAARCEIGELEHCYSLGVRKARRNRFEEAIAWLRIACDGGHAHACHEAGGIIAAGLVPAVDPDEALASLVRGCGGGIAASCERAATVAEGAEASALLARACALGSASACSAAGGTAP
jgi:TPR repeat protein